MYFCTNTKVERPPPPPTRFSCGAFQEANAAQIFFLPLLSHLPFYCFSECTDTVDSSLPPRKPSKGRKLAMRSYSLSFQTPAPASPPSKWTPALLEQSPPPPAACRGETLPKVKSVAAIPNVATSSFTVAAADLAVLSPGGKSSPTRKRPGKNSKKPKRSEAVLQVTEDDRRLEAAGSSAGKRRLEAASSTAEMEIERFEREFLQPLLETTSQQQQQQQLARLQSSCGDLPATTAVVTTASAAVEYHRDLRYQKCYILYSVI
jgi:hypothetical protein